MILAKGFLVTLVVGLVGTVASAKDCRQNSQSEFYCVEYISNYDGDTMTVNIPNIHKFFGENITVRLAGINAAELKSEDRCEIEMAEKAKAELTKVLEKARSIELKDPERDKYFRVRADVLVNGKSVSEHMLKTNLVLPYDGHGDRTGIDWCKVNKRSLETAAVEF